MYHRASRTLYSCFFNQLNSFFLLYKQIKNKIKKKIPSSCTKCEYKKIKINFNLCGIVLSRKKEYMYVNHIKHGSLGKKWYLSIELYSNKKGNLWIDFPFYCYRILYRSVYWTVPFKIMMVISSYKSNCYFMNYYLSF